MAGVIFDIHGRLLDWKAILTLILTAYFDTMSRLAQSKTSPAVKRDPRLGGIGDGQDGMLHYLSFDTAPD